MSEWVKEEDAGVSRVHCPYCGEFLGFRFKQQTPTEITKMKIKIGNKEYPAIDIPKEPLELFCPHCHQTFTLSNKGN